MGTFGLSVWIEIPVTSRDFLLATEEKQRVIVNAVILFRRAS